MDVNEAVTMRVGYLWIENIKLVHQIESLNEKIKLLEQELAALKVEKPEKDRGKHR